MASTDRIDLTYLITGLQYGGANIGMVRLLSGLDPEEYDITVIAVVETSDDVVDLLPEHVTVHRLNISAVTEAYRVLKLIPLLRGTDVLVCSLFHASVVGVPLAQLLRIPQVLVWQHNTQPANRLRYGSFHGIYRLSDLVLADSNRVESFVHSEYRIPTSKISVLPIAGVDTGRYYPADSETDADHMSVGTVGRLTSEKGFDDLFRCARQLGPEYQFYIAGDGPKREWMETHAPENINLCGTVPNEDIPLFLNRHDIYFQPSKREGLCMTVIEAMSCGLPVVGSNVGGIPESVVPGTTGYLCEPEDIDCFTDRLAELGSDPELRQQMGAAGRERVVDRYSQSVLVEKFEQVVQGAETQ